MTAPLQGIRVLDLPRLLTGAFATLMLAELGAEIIKVEDPDGADPTRR
jgi:alpha-methylacyl-CoA racemase